VFAIGVGRLDGEYLFQFKQSTVRWQMAQHIPGAAPHAARRHYLSWFRKNRMQEDVIRQLAGHAAESVTDIYSHQDEAFVRSEVERVGLNFSLEDL
jgi:hypothetical protein